MKQKGITVWEQHLERFVLGAAALFFIGFGAYQIISKPNSIENPKRGEISPGQIDHILEEEAGRLAEQLSPDAPSPVRLPPYESNEDAFERELVQDVSPTDALTIVWPSQSPFGEDPIQEDVLYVQPNIIAPHTLVVEQHLAGLSAATMELHPELADFRLNEPADFSTIVVAGLFNEKEVLASYRQEGPDGEQPIPALWYGDRVDKMDVILEREERVNGEWTDHTVIDLLPGQFTLRPQLREQMDKRDRDDLLEFLHQGSAQRQIIQPDFYELEFGDAIVPPDPRMPRDAGPVQLNDEERHLRAQQDRLRRLLQSRNRKLEELEELGGKFQPGGAGGPQPGRDPGGRGGEPRRGPKPRGAAKPGGVGAGAQPGGAGDGGGRAGGDPRRDPGGVDNQKRIERLQREIETLDRTISRIQDRIAEVIGPQMDVDEVEPAEEDSDQLIIWAYDISAKPQATYRYRLSVVVDNPFFGRRMFLEEEQQHLAKPVTITSEPSEWTVPFDVRDTTRVFVTRAVPGPQRGMKGLGQATAEVYRFFHGRWWLEQFNGIEPGERVGRERQVGQRLAVPEDVESVDFGTRWFVLDIFPDPGVGSRDLEEGLSSVVILYSTGMSPVELVHDPRMDRVNPERDRLQQEVADAENRMMDLAQAQ